MGDITRRSGVLRALAGAAAALTIRSAGAQLATGVNPGGPVEDHPGDVHLPNGKLQRDEILKAEYDQNLKDARELTDLTRTFELELEKSDRFVLSVGLLKKLDDIEKLTRRIHGRMRR